MKSFKVSNPALIRPIDKEELDLFRQWFNAVQDLNPKYLESKDYLLARRVYTQIGMTWSHRNEDELQRLLKMEKL